MTANNMAKRFASIPTATLRGFDIAELSTSTCNSTSNGRVPSQTTITKEPDAASSPLDKKMAEGLATSFNPRSVIAKTPNSLIAPKRFL